MSDKSIQKSTAVAFKGVLALIILLHHFTTTLSYVPVYLVWLKYIAFPIVGAFFFLSGYGLTGSLLGREDYLKGFLGKRFGKVLLPFVCIALTATIIFSISAKRFVNAFSISVMLQYWFIYVILAVYLVFFLIFRALPVKKGAWTLLAVTVIYIVISIFVNPVRNEMYASVIAVPLGVLFKVYEDRINELFEKRFVLKFSLLAAICFALFSLRLFLAYRGIESNALHTVMRNIITALFVWLTALFAQRTVIKGRALLFLGQISYEIYIIHPILIKLYLRFFKAPNGAAELAIMILAVAALSLLLSYLTNTVFSKILSNGGNKDVKKA